MTRVVVCDDLCQTSTVVADPIYGTTVDEPNNNIKLKIDLTHARDIWSHVYDLVHFI